MRVLLLGPTEVLGEDARRLAVGGPRVRALLARLALSAGRTVGTAALVDGLWGDAPPAGALNALQTLVSRLRQALPAGRVESGPGGYRLVLDPGDVDALRFEDLLGRGRDERVAGRPRDAIVLLREALELWRGEPLADLGEVPFAAAPAQRLADLRLAALENRIEADLALGRHAEVIADLQALVAEHPLREAFHGQLMRALAASGRTADALAVYDDARARLAGELGIDPSPDLRAAHLAVLRQRDDGPPPAPYEPARGNLTSHLTSFVGRDTETRQLAAEIRGHRLVTLVGPGGVGKTRLAGAAAAELARTLPDGAWFVELAPVRDPAGLRSALLSALDVPERGLVLDGPPPARDAIDRLVSALTGRRTLIVLDNCEHLVDEAAATVDRLLAACPGLRVLATSREPLGIAGEAVWPVAPLALPPEDAAPEDALGCPAVRLFADRAAAARKGYRPGPHDAAAVVQICRRLDGLPLAIELAAARMRSLSPAQIAERLDDRFRLLGTGSRTAPDRHRALHAAVAWSWDLLTEPERVLARRLAVFAGGASLEAAERICAGGPLPPADLAATLSALVDKSLVEAILPATGEARYRMLETVRAYVAERLAEAGERTAIGDAHARYFLDLAEAAEPWLRTARQDAWTARLDAERDNLQAALRWAIDTGDADTAVRLGAAQGMFWMLRGGYAGAVELTGSVLALPGPAPAPARTVLAASYALCLINDGRHPGEALGEAERLIAAQDPADRHPLSVVLEITAPMLAGEHDRTAAALERHRDHPDPWARAMVLLLEGFAAEQRGEGPVVEHRLTGAYEAFAALGERWGLIRALSGLAEARGVHGDHAGAVAAAEQALRAAEELDAREEAGAVRVLLARARARAGEPERAERELSAVLAAGPVPRETQILALCGLGEVARLDGRTPEARARYERARELFDERPGTAARIGAEVLVGLGWTVLADGPAARARELFRAGATLAAQDDYRPLLEAAAEGLARAAPGDGPDAGVPRAPQE